MILGDECSSFQWELRPTRSMSWRSAKVMMAAVTFVSILIGMSAVILGLPLILPFYGLEALCFCLAFYLVQVSGKVREILKIEDYQLVLKKISKKVSRCLIANKRCVKVLLFRPRSNTRILKLCLRYAGEEIELGRFLNDEEKTRFAKVLINAMN